MSARKAAAGDGPYPLPEGWRWAKLGEFMLSRGGAVKPADSPDEEFELYSIPAHDNSESGYEVSLGRSIGSSKAKVFPGDVLLSKIVPHIRRAQIVGDNHGRTQIASSEWIVFRTCEVDSGYLSKFLTSDSFHPRFMSTIAGVGGSLTRARPNFVKELEIPLPPLSEQRRIAKLLDAASRLSGKQDDREYKLASLIDHHFRHVFGDPSDWVTQREMKTIGELAQSVTYGSSSKSGNIGNFPILRMGNITDSGLIDSSDLKYLDISESEIGKYTVRPGDMLFNRTNSVDKVGKAAVVKSDFPLAYAGYLVRVRFADVRIADFVSAYLRSSHGKAARRKLAKAAVNQANISAKELKSIPVLIPNSGQLQSFSDMIKHVDERRRSYRVFSQYLDSLSSSLQYRAFRGEL